MDRPRCETCPFWDKLTDDVIAFGRCRRHPPTVIPNTYKVLLDDAPLTLWPKTDRSDYCGDHPDFPAYIDATRGQS